MTRYLARLSGSSWAIGPEAEFDTIAEARRWAESYGTTADQCSIIDLRRWSPRADHPARRHPIVAVHRRDPNGDGRRWYRAVPPTYPDDGATMDRDPLAASKWPGGGAR